MNNDLQAELELAVAELSFWLDFARWWRTRHCDEEEPRILEILEFAEKRYANAAREVRERAH